jgi:hypothetical protein
MSAPAPEPAEVRARRHYPGAQRLRTCYLKGVAAREAGATAGQCPYERVGWAQAMRLAWQLGYGEARDGRAVLAPGGGPV